VENHVVLLLSLVENGKEILPHKCNQIKKEKKLKNKLRKRYRMIQINNEFEVGERVHDDLTASLAMIIGISFKRGQKGLKDNSIAIDTIGYWVDNNYLGGGRYPWEITKIKK